MHRRSSVLTIMKQAWSLAFLPSLGARLLTRTNPSLALRRRLGVRSYANVAP